MARLMRVFLSKCAAMLRRSVNRANRALPGQQGRRGRDDPAHADWSLDRIEAEPPDLLCRQRSKCGHNEDTSRMKHDTHFLQRRSWVRQSLEVDEQYVWCHAFPTIQPRNGPGIDRDHVVTFFDQLSPKKRTFAPLGSDQQDIGGLRIHGQPD
jgi:hypothetical protein